MNIILTSQVSQIKSAEKFIKIYKLCDTGIIYISTKDIYAQDKLFQANIDMTVIKIFESFELPIRCNKPNLYTLYQVKKIFEKILKKYSPNKIYVFSWPKVYNIFIDEAHKLDIDISIIEEGLGQYVPFDVDEVEFSLKRAVNDCKLILFKYFSFYQKLKWELRLLLLPFYFCYSLIEFCKIYDITILINKIFLLNNPFFKLYSNFDRAYVFYPELLQNNIRANQFIKLDIGDFKIEDIMTKCKGKRQHRILFLSQTYANNVNFTQYYLSIFRILNSICTDTGSVIDYKFHPKENITAIKDLLATGVALHENIRLLQNTTYTAETIIAGSDYDVLMGICSSALVYAADIKSNILIYSIGRELLILLGKNAPKSLRNGINSFTSFNIRQYRLGTNF